MKPQINGFTLLGQGKFLTFRELHYTDDRGRDRKWESVDRSGNGAAAFMIATIEPEGDILLVRQFRPPAAKLMLEFPAGLIDPGETAAETAHRELYEETGFRGEIVHICQPGYSSPGLTGEAITLVRMKIDGAQYRDGMPKNAPEDTESIEVFRVPGAKLAEFVRQQEEQGVGIDTKIYTFLAAQKF